MKTTRIGTGNLAFDGDGLRNLRPFPGFGVIKQEVDLGNPPIFRFGFRSQAFFFANVGDYRGMVKLGLIPKTDATVSFDLGDDTDGGEHLVCSIRENSTLNYNEVPIKTRQGKNNLEENASFGDCASGKVLLDYCLGDMKSEDWDNHLPSSLYEYFTKPSLYIPEGVVQTGRVSKGVYDTSYIAISLEYLKKEIQDNYDDTEVGMKEEHFRQQDLFQGE